MDRIVTSRPNKERECNAHAADEQPPPPLLDSPLPTPRRSCAASLDAARLRCRRDNASPLRTHVPFSWESSPGVPKKMSACGKREVDVHEKKAAQGEEIMPPPPGRLMPPPAPCPAARNNWYYGNTSEASTDDEEDDRSFSDALDRISSPERTIGSSFDRVTSKRFEDIFVGRATSFAKDRSGSRHAAADDEYIDHSTSGRHPRHCRLRGSMRRSREEVVGWTPRQRLHDPVPMKLLQRIRMDAQAEEMSPRACGLMVFFPWSPKPAVCGFNKSPSQLPPKPRAIRADAPSPSSSSRSRSRGTTLRDAIKEENNEASNGLQQQQQHPRGEKRSRDREEWQQSRRSWGVSSLLDTSKKYCTDARKALSKLSIGRAATDTASSPRVSGERRSDKLQGPHLSTASTTTASKKPTQLKESTSRY